jgi:hypothetical protein
MSRVRGIGGDPPSGDAADAINDGTPISPQNVDAHSVPDSVQLDPSVDLITREEIR